MRSQFELLKNLIIAEVLGFKNEDFILKVIAQELAEVKSWHFITHHK